MSESKKLPEDRFLVRPEIDPKNEKAVDELADHITGWVMAQRKRVQAELAAKAAKEEDAEKRARCSSSSSLPAAPMAAKSRG